MLHMDIFKILDKLKNDKKSICPFSNTSRSRHKDIVRKKEMINLHEFDEKLSLTAKISCEVLSFVLKCSL